MAHFTTPALSRRIGALLTAGFSSALLAGEIDELAHGGKYADYQKAFQTDMAPYQSPLISMLGAPSDAVKPVETLTMAAVSLLTAPNGENIQAFSLSPATLFPERLFNAINGARPSLLARALSGINLSAGLGQGDETNASDKSLRYHTQAIGLQWSLYLHPHDDPLVTAAERVDAAYAMREASRKRAPYNRFYEAGGARRDLRSLCTVLAEVSNKQGTGDADDAALISLLRATSTVTDIPYNTLDCNASDPKDQERLFAFYSALYAQITKTTDASAVAAMAEMTSPEQLVWALPRVYASAGWGRIQLAEGSTNWKSLGQEYLLGIIWGDKIGASGKLAYSLASNFSVNQKRLTAKDFVMDPTRSGQSVRLFAARATIGSNKIRGMVEASKSNSNNGESSSLQFKRAAGIDFRITEGFWISARYGMRTRPDGKDEKTSIVSLSFAPKSDIGFGAN